MLSANEIRAVIRGNDKQQLTQVYSQFFTDTINFSCGDCINDAKKRLEIKANELDRLHSDIIVYVNVYKAKEEKRNLELEECLWQNQNNPLISKVVEVKDKRPTYNEFFEMFDKEAVNIIINSDIFFNESIKAVKGIKDNQCFALTRWDWNGNGHAKFLNRIDSQDAWAFRGRLRKNIEANFCLGVPGCDNRIAYLLKKS